MPVTTIDGHEIHVNAEGFLTEYDEWDRGRSPASLATAIGVEMTDECWGPIRFLREDFKAEGGHTPTPAEGLDRRRLRPPSGSFTLFPEEAGQEDGLHRRAAQARRLRLQSPRRPEPHPHSLGRDVMTTTQDAIIPRFDDDEEVEGGRKLAIICSKGNLDMAYPGLILGNAALGEGVELHLFFTFWGMDMIIPGRMEELKFSPERQHRDAHADGRRPHPSGARPDAGHAADGDQDAQEADRRPRRPRGPRVPRAHRRPAGATCTRAG